MNFYYTIVKVQVSTQKKIYFPIVFLRGSWEKLTIVTHLAHVCGKATKKNVMGDLLISLALNPYESAINIPVL